MKRHAKLVCVILWVCLAVFTFGHATNNKECGYQCITVATSSIAMFGIGVPFYWSWELQREEEQ